MILGGFLLHEADISAALQPHCPKITHLGCGSRIAAQTEKTKRPGRNRPGLSGVMARGWLVHCFEQTLIGSQLAHLLLQLLKGTHLNLANALAAYTVNLR